MKWLSYWPEAGASSFHSALDGCGHLHLFLLIIILLHLPHASYGYANSGFGVAASSFDHQQHSDLHQHSITSPSGAFNHLHVCRVGCAFALPSHALTEAPDHSLVIVEAGDYVEDAPPLWAPTADVRRQNVTLLVQGQVRLRVRGGGQWLLVSAPLFTIRGASELTLIDAGIRVGAGCTLVQSRDLSLSITVTGLLASGLELAAGATWVQEGRAVVVSGRSEGASSFSNGVHLEVAAQWQQEGELSLFSYGAIGVLVSGSSSWSQSGPVNMTVVGRTDGLHKGVFGEGVRLAGQDATWDQRGPLSVSATTASNAIYVASGALWQREGSQVAPTTLTADEEPAGEHIHDVVRVETYRMYPPLGNQTALKLWELMAPDRLVREAYSVDASSDRRFYRLCSMAHGSEHASAAWNSMTDYRLTGFQMAAAPCVHARLEPMAPEPVGSWRTRRDLNATRYSQGHRTALILRLSFQDSPSVTATSSIFSEVAVAVPRAVERLSSGVATLQMRYDADCVYVMDVTKAQVESSNALFALVMDAAQRAAVNQSTGACAISQAEWDAFNHAIAVPPAFNWGAAGTAASPGKNLLLNGDQGIWIQTIFHELGHSFGLPHASRIDVVRQRTHYEYGNPYDTMGSAEGYDPQFLAGYQDALGWTNKVSYPLDAYAAGPATVANYILPAIEANNGDRLETVRIPSIFSTYNTRGNGWIYLNWVNFVPDSFLSRGVLITEESLSLSWDGYRRPDLGDRSMLIDATPGTLSLRDGVVKEGSPLVYGLGGLAPVLITVTADQATASGMPVSVTRLRASGEPIDGRGCTTAGCQPWTEDVPELSCSPSGQRTLTVADGRSVVVLITAPSRMAAVITASTCESEIGIFRLFPAGQMLHGCPPLSGAEDATNNGCLGVEMSVGPSESVWAAVRQVSGNSAYTISLTCGATVPSTQRRIYFYSSGALSGLYELRSPRRWQSNNHVANSDNNLVFDTTTNYWTPLILRPLNAADTGYWFMNLVFDQSESPIMWNGRNMGDGVVDVAYACPRRMYAPSPGQCAACPTFMTNDRAGSRSLADCKCLPGYGRDASSNCQPCPAGTYSDGSGCINCASGASPPRSPGLSYCIAQPLAGFCSRYVIANMTTQWYGNGMDGVYEFDLDYESNFPKYRQTSGAARFCLTGWQHRTTFTECATGAYLSPAMIVTGSQTPPQTWTGGSFFTVETATGRFSALDSGLLFNQPGYPPVTITCVAEITAPPDPGWPDAPSALSLSSATAGDIPMGVYARVANAAYSSPVYALDGMHLAWHNSSRTWGFTRRPDLDGTARWAITDPMPGRLGASMSIRLFDPTTQSFSIQATVAVSVPTPSPTPTNSPTPSATPSNSQTPSQTPSNPPSPSNSPSASITPSPSPCVVLALGTNLGAPTDDFGLSGDLLAQRLVVSRDIKVYAFTVISFASNPPGNRLLASAQLYTEDAAVERPGSPIADALFSVNVAYAGSESQGPFQAPGGITLHGGTVYWLVMQPSVTTATWIRATTSKTTTYNDLTVALDTLAFFSGGSWIGMPRSGRLSIMGCILPSPSASSSPTLSPMPSPTASVSLSPTPSASSSSTPSISPTPTISSTPTPTSSNSPTPSTSPSPSPSPCVPESLVNNLEVSDDGLANRIPGQLLAQRLVVPRDVKLYAFTATWYAEGAGSSLLTSAQLYTDDEASARPGIPIAGTQFSVGEASYKAQADVQVQCNAPGGITLLGGTVYWLVMQPSTESATSMTTITRTNKFNTLILTVDALKYLTSNNKWIDATDLTARLSIMGCVPPLPSPSATTSPSQSPTASPSSLSPSPSASSSSTPSTSPSSTPSPTSSATASPTISLTPTPTPSNSATPSMTPSNTPTLTPSTSPTPSSVALVSQSPTASVSTSLSPSPSASGSSTPSASLSPITPSSSSPSASASSSLTSTPSVSPSLSPTPALPSLSATPTSTFTPSESPSASPSVSSFTSLTPSLSATPSLTITPTPSLTPSASASPFASGLSSPSSTPSESPSASSSPTATASVTVTVTPSSTSSPSAASPEASRTSTPTVTVTPSSPATVTVTPTPSASASPVLSPTSSMTSSPSASASLTPTPSASAITPSATASVSVSASPSRTEATATASSSATSTPSATPASASASPTPSATATASGAASSSPSPSVSISITTQSPSPSTTPTSSPTPLVSPSSSALPSNATQSPTPSPSGSPLASVALITLSPSPSISASASASASPSQSTPLSTPTPSLSTSPSPVAPSSSATPTLSSTQSPSPSGSPVLVTQSASPSPSTSQALQSPSPSPSSSLSSSTPTQSASSSPSSSMSPSPTVQSPSTSTSTSPSPLPTPSTSPSIGVQSPTPSTSRSPAAPSLTPSSFPSTVASSASPSASFNATLSPTPSSSPSLTSQLPSASTTPSASVSASASATASLSPSGSPSPTSTLSPSPTATQTPSALPSVATRSPSPSGSPSLITSSPSTTASGTATRTPSTSPTLTTQSPTSSTSPSGSATSTPSRSSSPTSSASPTASPSRATQSPSATASPSTSTTPSGSPSRVSQSATPSVQSRSPSVTPASSSVPTSQVSRTPSPSTSSAPLIVPLVNVVAIFGEAIPGAQLNSSVHWARLDLNGIRVGLVTQTIATNARSSLVTEAGVTSMLYNTTLVNNAALVQHPLAFGTAPRAMSFAGTDYTVPARAFKFSLQLDRWPGTAGNPFATSFTATYTLLVSSPVSSIRSTMTGDVTLWTIFTTSDVVVQVGTFRVAEFGAAGGGVDVRPISVTADVTNSRRVLFTFVFPRFTGSLNYDPFVYLGSTSSTASSGNGGGGSVSGGGGFSPIIAAAVAVPAALVIFVIIGLVVALIIWKRRKWVAPKPPKVRRGSSLYSHFSMQHNTDLFYPFATKRDTYELNRLTWQDA